METKQDQIDRLTGEMKVLNAKVNLVDEINKDIHAQREKIKAKLVYIEQITAMAIKSPDYINEDVRLDIIKNINIKCNE